MTASSRWISRSEGTVSPGGIADAACESRHQGVSIQSRVRLADDAPMAIEYATVLASCLASTRRSRHSRFTSALRDTGNQPVRALQRLSAHCF